MWLPLFWNTCKHCSRVEQDRSVQTMSLTPACCVHSNVYGLFNVHWIRYLTAVDSILSTLFAVQTYHHLTSGSVLVTIAGNSSSIGKEPVPIVSPIYTNIRWFATSSLVSYTVQGIILFTNVLQGYTTVVLVCSTIEWEPDITYTWEIWMFDRMYKLYIYSPIATTIFISYLQILYISLHTCSQI